MYIFEHFILFIIIIKYCHDLTYLNLIPKCLCPFPSKSHISMKFLNWTIKLFSLLLKALPTATIIIISMIITYKWKLNYYFSLNWNNFPIINFEAWNYSKPIYSSLLHSHFIQNVLFSSNIFQYIIYVCLAT